MDMNFISEMYMPIVIVACLLIGYIIKKWVADVDNKWIPTIVFVLGGIFACIVKQSIGFETIVAGCASGLASTGLHQAYKQLIGEQ